MSETNEESKSEGNITERRPYVPQTGDQLDWFLQTLVLAMQGGPSGSISASVTLSVGGLLISGKMVDGQTYFEEFARELEGPLSEAFVKAFGNEEEAGLASGQIAEAFRKYGDIYNPPAEGEKESRARTEPGYVHLKNARIYHPSGQPIPMGGHGLL